MHFNNSLSLSLSLEWNFAYSQPEPDAFESEPEIIQSRTRNHSILNLKWKKVTHILMQLWRIVYNYISFIINYISSISFIIFCMKVNTCTRINIQIYSCFIWKIFRTFFEKKSGQPDPDSKSKNLIRIRNI